MMSAVFTVLPNVLMHTLIRIQLMYSFYCIFGIL